MPEVELGDSEVADLVRGGYDAIADRYAAYAAAGSSHPRHAWLDVLLSRLPTASRVLELGCGPGVPTAARIVASGHRLVGVDISARQLDTARRHVPDAVFVTPT